MRRRRIDGREFVCRTTGKSEMNNENQIERIFCNSCKQETKHYVRARHTSLEHDEAADADDTQEMMIVECCGCEHLAFLKRVQLSEVGGIEIDPETGDAKMVPQWDDAIYPPVDYRTPPRWLEDLPDDTLRRISREVYKSLQTESPYLATFGSRTLLDRLMVLTVGDRGTFGKSLSALVDEGKISNHEREILGSVLEAGNAAAHRAWTPEPEHLKTILDIVEGLIYTLLVSPKLAEELEEAVPSRSGPSATKPTHQVNIEGKIAEAPDVVRKIFFELEVLLKSFGRDVKVHMQKHYVAFRRRRNFASVLIYNQKRQVRVYLNLDPDEVDLSRPGLRDVRQVGHYGTGDLELTIRDEEELESFGDLMKDSYLNS